MGVFFPISLANIEQSPKGTSGRVTGMTAKEQGASETR